MLGKVESFNLATTTGIVLYEAVKQRKNNLTQKAKSYLKLSQNMKTIHIEKDFFI